MLSDSWNCSPIFIHKKLQQPSFTSYDADFPDAMLLSEISKALAQTFTKSWLQCNFFIHFNIQQISHLV